MKKIIIAIVVLLALALPTQAQVFLIDADENVRTEVLGNELPFFPGHGADWDQGYVPAGSGAALLIGFGAAYLLAKKRKK